MELTINKGFSVLSFEEMSSVEGGGWAAAAIVGVGIVAIACAPLAAAASVCMGATVMASVGYGVIAGCGGVYTVAVGYDKYNDGK